MINVFSEKNYLRERLNQKFNCIEIAYITITIFMAQVFIKSEVTMYWTSHTNTGLTDWLQNYQSVIFSNALQGGIRRSHSAGCRCISRHFLWNVTCKHLSVAYLLLTLLLILSIFFSLQSKYSSRSDYTRMLALVLNKFTRIRYPTKISS